MTTADVVSEIEAKKIAVSYKDMEGSLKEIQKVLAVGNVVTSIKPGDYVMIKYDRYVRIEHQKGNYEEDLNLMKDSPVVRLDVPIIDLDGTQVLLLQDSDVRFVIEEYDTDVIEETVIAKPKIEI